MQLFEQAHWEGNIDSTYWLGLCCKNGWGLTIDYERAVFLLNECLETKPEAGFELGECARSGQGTPKNFERAFDHYLKAAEDGSSEAKAAIGRAFFLGEGVTDPPLSLGLDSGGFSLEPDTNIFVLNKALSLSILIAYGFIFLFLIGDCMCFQDFMFCYLFPLMGSFEILFFVLKAFSENFDPAMNSAALL